MSSCSIPSFLCLSSKSVSRSLFFFLFLTSIIYFLIYFLRIEIRSGAPWVRLFHSHKQRYQKTSKNPQNLRNLIIILLYNLFIYCTVPSLLPRCFFETLMRCSSAKQKLKITTEQFHRLSIEFDGIF